MIYMNNYHTHTKRCTHAYGSEEEMVKKAISEGYTELGFSEHVPLPYFRWHLIKALPFAICNLWTTLSWIKAFLFNGPGMRMPYKEKQEHLNEVRRLKEKYKSEINIKIGFECDYLEEYLPYYQKILHSNEVDYLILGHHFDKYAVSKRYYARPNIDIENIKNYVESAKKAMRTGLFSCFAHPDLFMNGYHEWNEEVEQLIYSLCLCAKECDLPLEINAGGIRRGNTVVKEIGYQGYPNYNFFKIASELGCKVIIGMDAHDPKHLNKEDFQILEEFARELNLNIITTLE